MILSSHDAPRLQSVGSFTVPGRTQTISRSAHQAFLIDNYAVNNIEIRKLAMHAMVFVP